MKSILVYILRLYFLCGLKFLSITSKYHKCNDESRKHIRYIQIVDKKSGKFDFLQTKLDIYSNSTNVSSTSTIKYYKNSSQFQGFDGNPYWLVDLGKSVSVDFIVFHNRKDCCQSDAIGVVFGLFENHANDISCSFKIKRKSLIQTINFPYSAAKLPPNYVSVVLTTYNRFNLLLNAVRSIQNQTYKNIEIIIVNDKSSDPRYLTYYFRGCTILHTDKSSKERGDRYPHPQRQPGIDIATGDYIAFLDDDDEWLSTKLDYQVNAMKQYAVEASCSEGLRGEGRYQLTENYPLYNGEFWKSRLDDVLKTNGYNCTADKLPVIWDQNFIEKHNFCIGSTMIVSRRVVISTGEYIVEPALEDWFFLKRVLKFTNITYVSVPLVYYDGGHGRLE